MKVIYNPYRIVEHQGIGEGEFLAIVMGAHSHVELKRDIGCPYDWDMEGLDAALLDSATKIEIEKRKQSKQPYGESVMQVLRQRRWLDPSDDSCDEELQAMSPEKVFEEIALWHLSARGWARAILGWIEDCGGKIVWPTEDKENSNG